MWFSCWPQKKCKIFAKVSHSSKEVIKIFCKLWFIEAWFILVASYKYVLYFMASISENYFFSKVWMKTYFIIQVNSKICGSIMKAKISKLFYTFVEPIHRQVIILRTLTGTNHRQIILHRLQKVPIWTFGLLVHQINCL